MNYDKTNTLHETLNTIGNRPLPIPQKLLLYILQLPPSFLFKV